MRLVLIVLATIFSFMWPIISADDYKLGSECPKVDPVPNFDIQRFAGLWYVVEEFDASSPCWTYFFVVSNTTNTSTLIESRNELINRQFPEKTPGNIGKLEPVDPAQPGLFTVSFSDNIIGKAKFTVYFTDYDNYGAVFRCQSVLFGRRQSATILSRQMYLEASYLNRARAKLISFNVPINSFKSVAHTNCVHTPKLSFGSLFNRTRGDFAFDEST